MTSDEQLIEELLEFISSAGEEGVSTEQIMERFCEKDEEDES